MRNKNDPADKFEIHTFSKHHGECRIYSALQLACAKSLESNPTVKEFITNVQMTGTEYTSDFLITYQDDSVMVQECIRLEDYETPMGQHLIEQSKEYWISHGVWHWGLVVETN